MCRRDSEPQLFSDIWPLTLSDGDADHHLEAGSDSVEGRRIVNISYLASHIIRKQLNVLLRKWLQLALFPNDPKVILDWYIWNYH